MASTQLSETHSAMVEHVAEIHGDEKPTSEEAGRGFWRALRLRVLNVHWNYMGQLAQEGLISSGSDFDDP